MPSCSRLVTVHAAGHSLLLIAAMLFGIGGLRAQHVPADAGERQYEELRKIYREHKERHAKGLASEEDIFGRDAWFHYQRSFPFGQIPAEGRVDAIRATAEIEQALERSWSNADRTRSLLSATAWESIGPSNQGGRIRAVANHPTKAGVVLVGAAAGGVWKTTDAGSTWRPTFDKESAIAVGSLAFDYSNPNVVYAGTGENFPSSPTLLVNTPSYLGNGVFKSTDEGETWTRVGLESAGAVSKIFVNRQNPAIVYAAAARQNGGLYRSSDAGATWARTLAGEFFDMSVNPLDGDEVYVAQPSGVLRSTNAGLSFSGATTGMNSGSGVRISIAVAPSSPSQLYALAARGSGAGEIAEVYASTDKGTSWRLLRSFGTSFFNGQGVYDNFIAVHTTDPNVVIIGGIDVQLTTDGGDSWSNTTRSYTGGSVHPDQHVAEFDPKNPDVIILGNDGGVYESRDAGVSWTHRSDGLAVTQYYRMEVDQSRPFRVYGGTQDNGTSGSFGTGGFTDNWTRVLGGDGFFVVADQGDPDWFYAEVYYGTLFRISAVNPGQATRIDFGIPSSGPEADEGNWATPIAMSPADRVSLYSGRRNLWRTTNRGGNWTRINVGVSSKLSAIGLSPTDTRDIVVGSVTGQVRYSTDYGATWGSASGLPNAVVTDLRFDPVRSERVYATYSGFGAAHVFRSDSRGAQWVDLTANLPNIPVNAIEIDPEAPDRLFIATDVGVFFSPNGGGFWIPFNPGLPLAPISDLRIHYASRALIAATHGRSMFRVDIARLAIEPTLVQPIGGERISTPGPLDIVWFGFDGPVDVSIRYSADEPYQLLAAGVTGDRVTVTIPMRLSTTARVRVSEVGTGRTVTSGLLTLVTPANTTSLGRRGFVAEAIEMRGSMLWATARGSDTIYRMRVPLLTGASSIVRSGFSGTIRDLALDSARDEFFALVTDDDFTRPRIHRMDTTGASLGAITLPAELSSAVGIAIRDGVLVVVTAEAEPVLWLLDISTGEELGRLPIEGAEAGERRGLVWNGRAFVQAARDEEAAGELDTELQQIAGTAPARVFERMAVVTSAGGDLRIVGLAHDPGAAGTEFYFATDTSGTFYRFRADVLAGFSAEDLRGGSTVVAGATIRPNPAQRQAAVELRLERAAQLRISIIDATGAGVVEPIERQGEPGAQAITLPIGPLASGMYYVVIESGPARVVRALSIVR